MNNLNFISFSSRLTLKHWKLLDLLHELSLDVHGVGLLVLEILGGDPAGLLSEMFPHVPPVRVVPLQHVNPLALHEIHGLPGLRHKGRQGVERVAFSNFCSLNQV